MINNHNLPKKGNYSLILKNCHKEHNAVNATKIIYMNSSLSLHESYQLFKRVRDNGEKSVIALSNIAESTARKIQVQFKANGIVTAIRRNK